MSSDVYLLDRSQFEEERQRKQVLEFAGEAQRLLDQLHIRCFVAQVKEAMAMLEEEQAAEAPRKPKREDRR